MNIKSKFVRKGIGRAHLVLSDHPHASAAASVGRFEDDGEAVALGEGVGLLQTADGGVCSRDYGYALTSKSDALRRNNPSIYEDFHYQETVGHTPFVYIPALIARLRASTLSPILRTVSGVGPTNITSASAQA